MKRLAQVLGLVAVLALLAAQCGPAPTPEVIEKEVVVTQEVEVIVTKEVEKIVEVEKEVEVEKIVEVEKEVLVTATSAPEEEVITLRFLGWILGEESTASAWFKMVELYESEHPNIKIESIPTAAGGQDVINFMLMVGAGDAPDVLQGTTPRMGAVIKAGAIRPLEDLVRPEILDGLVDRAVDVNYWPDGHLYGLPWTPINRQVYWNVTLAEQAGLDVNNLPNYLPDFDKAMHAIAALGTDEAGQTIFGFGRRNNRHWLTGAEFGRWMWMWNTDFLDEGLEKVIVDQPPAVEVATFLKQCVDDMACTQNSWVQDNYNLFVEDRVAAIEDGSNVLGVFRLSSGQGEAYDANVAFTPPIYYENGVPQGDLWPHTVMISSQSEHPEEAMRFAEFLVSDPRAIDIYYDLGTAPPFWKESLAQPKYQDDPFVMGFLNQVPNDKVMQLGYLPEFTEASWFAGLAINKIENLDADIQTELTVLAENLRVLLKKQ
jgi:multiple sugar transport system substrate-binding protein